jgi:nucleotide-binding universal stress UspA family protein
MASTFFRRVLVPHDFSTGADQALRAAAGLAEDAGGRLTVLHVLSPTYALSDPLFTAALPPPETTIPEVKAALEGRIAKVLARSDVPVTTVVRVGHPAETIVEAADKASSIVMSTHGRVGVSHLLLGSVAERVVRISPIPVLTIRPRGHAKPARRGASRTRSRR